MKEIPSGFKIKPPLDKEECTDNSEKQVKMIMKKLMIIIIIKTIKMTILVQALIVIAILMKLVE
jgi:hypothetical protein